MVALSKLAKDMRKWLALSRPQMANAIIYTEKVLEATEEIPGLGSIKVVTLCCDVLRGTMVKWHEKRIDKAERGLAGVEDVEDMTEEQRELMEFLAASRDQMMDQVAAGFLDLKQDIQEVKVLVNKDLDAVNELLHLGGIKRVFNVYTDMLASNENLRSWALHFRSNYANFREVLGDFEAKNVRELLVKVYQNNCQNNIDSFYEKYRFIIDSRCLFTLIMVTYFSNLPKQVLEELNIDQYEECARAVLDGETAIKAINEAADEALDGFFIPWLFASPEMKAKLKLKYCPSVDEWPKNKDTFIRKTTWRRLFRGETAGLFAERNLEVYKGTPGFLLARDTEYNYEQIFQADVEKLRLLDGICRETDLSSGETEYGTQILSEGHFVCKISKEASGEIVYHDAHAPTCVFFNTSSLEWKDIYM